MIAPNKSFGCPQCGGTASPVAGRDYLQCNYCDSFVFSHDNPLTVDRITPVDGELDAQCPVCDEDLHTGNIEDRPVLYCNGCYGFLLKNANFGTIVRQRRARRAGCEAAAPKPLDQQQYQRQIRCPSCRKDMEVHPYYGPGNVVIDSCHRCSYVWLDHGELFSVERAEGSREPAPLPLHINEDGEVTVIPPAGTTKASTQSHATTAVADLSAMALADILFDLW